MTAVPGTIEFEAFGRRFIILRNEKEKQQWLTSHDAITESHIDAARHTADIFRKILSYEELDKLISPDEDITVTNDGATILKNMEVDEIAKLMFELAKSRNEKFVQYGPDLLVPIMMLAKKPLDMEIHPIRIADIFELAARSLNQHISIY